MLHPSAPQPASLDASGSAAPGLAAAVALPFDGGMRVQHGDGFPPGPVGLSVAGEALLRAWSMGATAWELVVPRRRLLALAAAMTDPTIAEAMALVGSHIVDVGSYSELTTTQLMREMARFCALLDHYGVRSLDEVTEQHARDYMYAAVQQPSGRFTDPADATVRARRTTIRTLFSAARFLGLASNDPARDIVLPPRSGLKTRPLTDEEELLCRLVAAHTLTELRRPAAWALGQAGATTTEQAGILRRHVDLAGARVWIDGGDKRASRWGALTEWGVEALGEALRHVSSDPNAGVVYSAQRSTASGAASVCTAVSAILRDAGLAVEPDIQPKSLMAWAGVRIYEATGDIIEVAKGLGCTSLDTAAQAIGLHWHGA